MQIFCFYCKLPIAVLDGGQSLKMVNLSRSAGTAMGSNQMQRILAS